MPNNISFLNEERIHKQVESISMKHCISFLKTQKQPSETVKCIPSKDLVFYIPHLEILRLIHLNQNTLPVQFLHQISLPLNRFFEILKIS